MQTIYIDVLLTLNIYVNFFLLRITARLTHSPLKAGRCILAAAYGSLYSLTIILPEMPTPLSVAVKLFAACTMSAIAFGYRSRRLFILNTAAFLAANFVLAGTVYAVYTWLSPESVHFANGSFYIDLSLIVLIVTTAVMYLAVYVFRLLTDSTADRGTYSVTIRKGRETVRLSGLADTGNSLVDFFTGAPVIICGSGSFSEMPRTRLIPCGTVSGNGLLPVFKPDEVVITDCTSGETKPVTAVIGIGESGENAVFNPKILN